MMHLQNALDRLKRSGTTYQYLVITEVQREVQRLADAYDRVEKTLKETQDAAYWFLDSLQYAANTKVSMNTQQKITALRNALDKSGYRPIGRDESPLPPPKNPNGRPDHIADADKMVLDDPHPPHRLCECTACLEYWTPKPTCDHIAGGGKVILTAEQAQQIEKALSCSCGILEAYSTTSITARQQLEENEKALSTIRAARAQEQAEQEPVTKRLQQQVDYWINHYDRKSPADMELLQKDVAKFAEDAFAASGKPIAEQTNTQFMEGYRIGLAEMREKCAKVVTEHAPTCSPHWASYVVAIRAIKFEGDTGFRPVSEMIAEHKQDPKKAAAIEKAKMRKAEQEPVAWRNYNGAVNNRLKTAAPQPVQKPTDCPCCGAKGTVIPSAFCRECKSDFWPPSVPANPTQPD